MSVLLFSHFHKEFPFYHESSWIKPTFASDSVTTSIPGGGNYIDVNTGYKSIMDFKHYYSSITDDEFIKAMGAEATSYWLLQNANHFEEEYIGNTSYRRYFMLNGDSNVPDKLVTAPTPDICQALAGEQSKQIAIDLFKEVDMIVTKPMDVGISIERQYLQYELPEYWHLFKEALIRVNPFYRKHIDWFTTSTVCHYEAVFVARKDIYKRMFYEYYEAMEYVWSKCSEVFPDKSKKHYDCSEPLPWRYPGFLNERFVSFFIFANDIKRAEAPLVVLQ